MTMLETKIDRNQLAAGAGTRADRAPESATGEADLPLRSNVNWDETMLDYAAIERRAQEMRSEAAWQIFSAVHDWAVNLFRHGKAKARAAAQAPLESHVQSS